MNYLFKSFRNNFWRLLELFDDVTRLQSPTMVEVSLKTWRISLRDIFSKCYKLIRLLPLTWKSKTFLFFECPETVSMITQIGLFHRVQVFLFLQALETGQAREMSKQLCENFRTLITRTKGKNISNQHFQSWGAEILRLTGIQASNNEPHTQHAKIRQSWTVTLNTSPCSWHCCCAFVSNSC